MPDVTLTQTTPRPLGGRPGALTPNGIRLAAAASGVLAGATAVAVGHLLAVLIAPAASPLLAVGSTLIDLAPQPVKAFAIATFGESDKIALLAGIGATLVVLAAVIGLVAYERPRLGALAVGAFGLVGAAAALARPTSTPLAILPSIVGAVAGIVALLVLRRLVAEPAGVRSVDRTRRGFLLGAGAVTLLAATSGGLGILLARARTSTVGRLVLPMPMDPAPALPAGADLAIDVISPFYTPNADFYRVDTALDVPAVDASTWSLRIHGMVDREVTLTLDELLELPTIERDITLSCVSNQVGGPYVGNARWIGIPLGTVLELAGVQDGADQLVSRSIDGMTIGTPTAVALDGRDAMLAVGMNGEPLPAVNGYPVRMLVPGLYGYVSATKWLVELELTTFSAYDPYWVQRGWAKEAPVKTMSRIDAPRPLATIPAGNVTVGGVAWAQHRGIDTVELRVDEGDWKAARLSTLDSIDTWRQWTFDWTATTGRHRLEVRATDADGAIQPEDRTEPFPNGATGWHAVVVTVA
jgi:DMSO/TMAO reductase YedYZ molybdopterin-dependent catalytic subunit